MPSLVRIVVVVVAVVVVVGEVGAAVVVARASDAVQQGTTSAAPVVSDTRRICRRCMGTTVLSVAVVVVVVVVVVLKGMGPERGVAVIIGLKASVVGDHNSPNNATNQNNGCKRVDTTGKCRLGTIIELVGETWTRRDNWRLNE